MAHKHPRDPGVTTGEEWRALGFYHELDDEQRCWRLVGSRAGLLTLAHMLTRHGNDATAPVGGALALGPYQDLKIRIWERPGIDDESIHGTAADLRRLGELIEHRLRSASPGSAVVIGPEYEQHVEYSLRFEVTDDRFDPSTVTPTAVREPDPVTAAPTSYQLPSIPFTFHDPDAILTESEGLVRYEHGALVVEYQTKDAFIGAVKSDVTEVEIPLDAISSVTFKRGLFGARLAVQARDMKSVGGIPSSKMGRVRLKFKRAHRDAAEELARTLDVDLARNL